MSEYQEFTGKTVEEALRHAREAFGVSGLDDLDFEILTPGSRGVLGMGAEPARVIAAPRSALGGSAPRREAAASVPLPPPPPREDRREGGFREGGFRDRDREGGFREGGFRDRDRGAGRPGDRDRGPRRDDRGFGRRDDRPGRDRPDRPDRPEGAPSPEGAPASAPAFRAAPEEAPSGGGRESAQFPSSEDTGARPAPAGGRDAGRDAGRGGQRTGGPRQGQGRPQAPTGRPQPTLTAGDLEQVAAAARAPMGTEREEIQAAEASPEALETAREILETLMGHIGIPCTVSIEHGTTSKVEVRGEPGQSESLAALIGRKGERLSALQHLVNLILSRRLGEWTRVLVDVEDYRGRRERQLQDIAQRAAARVLETGKMLQLEPMPALERRWVHLTLRDHPRVATQSIGEEPNRRVVVIRREV